ncbi:MAG: ATP synthase F0 subunit A [Phycisphaerae bacterium]|nr:ATP synthase F0 subunit A [Phycisphaerae bacterium]
MIPFIAADNPIHHILDKPVSGAEHITLFGKPAITIHMVSLLIAAIVAFIVLRIAARNIAIGREEEGTDRYLTSGKLSSIIEVISLYMRDNVIKPVLGHETAKFLPYLLSLFFFILTCNLLGMIPFMDMQVTTAKLGWGSEVDWAVFGGTATSNLGVTLGLGIVSFIVIQIHAFKSLGLGGWAHHLTGGAPLYLLPIMLPIELMGIFIKPAALAIRLFANMVAGHTMLAVLMMFGMLAFKATGNWVLTGGVELISTIAAVCISFLELFVAFLQAFIFMFLTTVFIGQMSHHDDEHGHAEAAH